MLELNIFTVRLFIWSLRRYVAIFYSVNIKSFGVHVYFSFCIVSFE